MKPFRISRNNAPTKHWPANCVHNPLDIIEQWINILRIVHNFRYLCCGFCYIWYGDAIAHLDMRSSLFTLTHTFTLALTHTRAVYVYVSIDAINIWPSKCKLPMKCFDFRNIYRLLDWNNLLWLIWKQCSECCSIHYNSPPPSMTAAATTTTTSVKKNYVHVHKYLRTNCYLTKKNSHFYCLLSHNSLHAHKLLLPINCRTIDWICLLKRCAADAESERDKKQIN